MKSTSQQVDNNSTFQARIDRGWWKILSQLHIDTGKSFRELIEDALMNTYAIGSGGVWERIENSDNVDKRKSNIELTRC